MVVLWFLPNYLVRIKRMGMRNQTSPVPIQVIPTQPNLPSNQAKPLFLLLVTCMYYSHTHISFPILHRSRLTPPPETTKYPVSHPERLFGYVQGLEIAFLLYTFVSR